MFRFEEQRDPSLRLEPLQNQRRDAGTAFAMSGYAAAVGPLKGGRAMRPTMDACRLHRPTDKTITPTVTPFAQCPACFRGVSLGEADAGIAANPLTCKAFP